MAVVEDIPVTSDDMKIATTPSHSLASHNSEGKSDILLDSKDPLCDPLKLDSDTMHD